MAQRCAVPVLLGNAEALEGGCCCIGAWLWLASLVTVLPMPGCPLNPWQSKWPLMVAGCLRRVGRLEEALLQYRQVYRMCPTNPEALRYLVALSGVREPRIAAHAHGSAP